MILQALVRHYETLANQEKVSRQGWCRAKVSYALDIDRNGNIQGIISLKTEEERGKKKVWVPSLIEVPEMEQRSSGILANFLCDNSKYMLGIDKEGAEKRSQDCFEAAKKKHLEILDSIQDETAEMVKNFFRTWNPEKAKENVHVLEKWDELTEGGNLIFYTRTCYAQEVRAISDAWLAYKNVNEKGTEGICLVTGDRSKIARIHSTIKGVQGAQSSGAALVSFNASAFESYGKEQSYNAPVGRYAAFAYTTALNYLLAQREYVFRLGDTTIVFWAEDGNNLYQDFFAGCMEPQEDNQETIRGVFENLQKGHAIDIQGIELNPEQEFYILGLAPNAARLSVRFFYEDSFGNILSNIKKHYQQMEIRKPTWDTKEYLGVGAIIRETTNQKSKEAKPMPGMAASLFESILSGSRYPESLYNNVLIRIRAEQGTVGRTKAAIIKAHLIRNNTLLCTPGVHSSEGQYNAGCPDGGGNQRIKEGTFVSLNESCGNTAYILGREFAILEAIQEEANPGINTTIKDRFFNSACATPAAVFPILFKLKESHTRKLKNEKKGTKIHYENILTELQGKILVNDNETAYPKRLSLEEQGMFILGYYHQLQKRFEKKEEKKDE